MTSSKISYSRDLVHSIYAEADLYLCSLVRSGSLSDDLDYLIYKEALLKGIRIAIMLTSSNWSVVRDWDIPYSSFGRCER